MTKIEAYRLVHRFFMEYGLVQKFCNNVIEHHQGTGIQKLRGKTAKDILKFVINKYVFMAESPVFMFVWIGGFSSFSWLISNEGEEFWTNCIMRWRRFIENNNINKDERIEE